MCSAVCECSVCAAPEGDAPAIVQRNEEEYSPLGQCDSPAGVLVSPNSEQVFCWCATADGTHSMLLLSERTVAAGEVRMLVLVCC